MRYTLRQLEIFLAVARHENVSRAAESLHMSQSAISEALLNFEHGYDVQLFDRMKNKLALNSVGRSLRKEAENVLRQCQAFDIAMQSGKELGHLKVGASLTIGNYLATHFLASYRQLYSDAEVQLDIASTPEIVTKVLNYEVDIGMIEAEVQHKDLEVSPWRQDELIVFCAAHHPLAKKTVLTTADLKAADWILREPGSGARRTFDRALAGLLPDINVVLEFGHNEAIKNAVESGLGIGCLSNIVLRKDLASGDLVPLTLRRRDMKRTFYFIAPKTRISSAGMKSWVQLCKSS
jgi:DNA-binding transcriptional LysR family regulator